MRILLSLLLLAISVVPVTAREQVEFGDWRAACRSDGYCSATAYENGGAGERRAADYILRIGRGAGSDHWEISFNPVEARPATGTSFDVTVDDESLTFAGSRQFRAYGTMGDLFLLGEGAQAVLDRLPPGRRIDFAFDDAEGTVWRTSFSLSGLTAALLWIDERQEQLGSRRIAGAPPVGIDPTVPDPIDDEASYGDLPPALLAFIAADPECRPFVDLANGADIEVDPVFGPHRKLYILPCWSAAYNFGWKVFVEESGKISLVALPEYSPDTGWTATTHIVNYWYDPATRELHSFNKGRGMGDCGSSGLWRWHKYDFRLIEFTSKGCDGKGDPGISRWCMN